MNQVRDFRLGEKRDNPVELDSKDLTGINRLEYINLPVIGNLLKKWDIMPSYDLFGTNCQTLTADVQQRLINASNAVYLHLPGTNEKASVNDRKKILDYIKSRFPNWMKKKLVRIPELQVPYAIKIKQDEKQLPAFATSDAIETNTQVLEELSLKVVICNPILVVFYDPPTLDSD